MANKSTGVSLPGNSDNLSNSNADISDFAKTIADAIAQSSNTNAEMLKTVLSQFNNGGTPTITQGQVAKDAYTEGMKDFQATKENAANQFLQDVKDGKLGGYVNGSFYHTFPVVLPLEKECLTPFELVLPWKGHLIRYIWREKGKAINIYGVHAEAALDYINKYNTKKSLDKTNRLPDLQF